MMGMNAVTYHLIKDSYEICWRSILSGNIKNENIDCEQCPYYNECEAKNTNDGK